MPRSPTTRSTCCNLRRPGRDCDPERAPVQRDQGGTGQQTATAEMLQVISGSLTDTRAGFREDRRQRQHLFATVRLGLLPGRRRQTAACRGMAAAHPRAVARTFRGLPIDADDELPVRVIRRPPDAPPSGYLGNDRSAARGAWRDRLDSAMPRWRVRCRCCGRAAASACSICAMRQPQALHRQGTGAAQVLRRPGGDRDPELAPVQRDQGSARSANGDLRGPARDQRIADRYAAGVRRRGGALPGYSAVRTAAASRWSMAVNCAP